MKVTSLSFAPNEQHMLFGLLALMFKASEDQKADAAPWLIIGQKIKSTTTLYSEGEVDLLKLAVESTIAAGERMLTKLPEDDAVSRMRAGVVKQTYITIKERLDNVQFRQLEIHPEPQNLRGDNEERGTAEGDSILLQGADGGTPPSGDGSSAGT